MSIMGWVSLATSYSPYPFIGDSLVEADLVTVKAAFLSPSGEMEGLSLVTIYPLFFLLWARQMGSDLLSGPASIWKYTAGTHFISFYLIIFIYTIIGMQFYTHINLL
jgi:hypothetical protein